MPTPHNYGGITIMGGRDTSSRNITKTKFQKGIFFCKTLYNHGNKNKVTIYTPQLTITERIAFICVNMMSMCAHSNRDNTINVTFITSEIYLRFYTQTASHPHSM